MCDVGPCAICGGVHGGTRCPPDKTIERMRERELSRTAEVEACMAGEGDEAEAMHRADKYKLSQRILELEAERVNLRGALQAFIEMITPFVLTLDGKEFHILESVYEPIHKQAREVLDPSVKGAFR